MTGVGYQSSDLLTRFNQYTGRPTSDSVSDTVKYQFLADAQAELIGEMVSIAPKPFITGPVNITANTTLSILDAAGNVLTTFIAPFGTTPGTNIVPFPNACP